VYICREREPGGSRRSREDLLKIARCVLFCIQMQYLFNTGALTPIAALIGFPSSTSEGRDE